MHLCCVCERACVRLLDVPTQICIDGDDVFVSDRDRARVEQWTRAGAFVRSFGRRGRAPGEFRSAEGVAVVGAHLVVADWERGDLEVFARGTGLFVRRCERLDPSAGEYRGGGGDDGSRASESLRRPWAMVYVPHEGRLYVADSLRKRVFVYE